MVRSASVRKAHLGVRTGVKVVDDKLYWVAGNTDQLHVGAVGERETRMNRADEVEGGEAVSYVAFRLLAVLATTTFRTRSAVLPPLKRALGGE